MPILPGQDDEAVDPQVDHEVSELRLGSAMTDGGLRADRQDASRGRDDADVEEGAQRGGAALQVAAHGTQHLEDDQHQEEVFDEGLTRNVATLLVTTARSTPAASAARITVAVPSTLLRMISPGSGAHNR